MPLESIKLTDATKGIAMLISGVGCSNAGNALNLVSDGKSLKVSLYYDFSDAPLTLLANRGECWKLIILPYRIELYAKDEDEWLLCDEEWPCGTPKFSDSTLSGELCISSEPYRGDSSELPTVLRSFEGFDNIRLPGVNIGDCMPFSIDSDPSVYHLYYLYDRHHHRSKWGLGAHQWAHISTVDLLHFEEHPMAVEITEPWEGSICTGSVIYAQGRYYAFYAIRMSDRSPAKITMSVSEDGYHFKKQSGFFTLPAAYERTSARDPKVFCFDGAYHMLVTTSLISDGRGCLAHLKADSLDSLDGWEDCGAAYISPDGSQPECPDWFKWDDTYYLIVGIHGAGRYVYSDAPFGPWSEPDDNFIPCGSVPKSALLGECRIFMGFRGNEGYAGELVCVQASMQPDKTLSFNEIRN